MYFKKVGTPLSVGFVPLAILFILIITVGLMSPASAQPLDADTFTSTIVFQDPPAMVQITDLNGNSLGEGEHGGQVRCYKDTCNKVTELQLNDIAYRYKAKTILALDLIAARVIVEGTGTIDSNGQKEGFTYTAIFQGNLDNTISVSYQASNPNASFIILNTPGTLTISSK